MKNKSRLGIVLTYAAAMAWVEAAVVIYLRTLIHRVVPYQADPLPVYGGLGSIEMIREAATLVMLLCVGWSVGRSIKSRLAYTAIAFGTWDIFYYIFLWIIGPWPKSFLDWDILFLLPLPWWGPVIAPVLIAVLVVTGGILVTALEEENIILRMNFRIYILALLGAALALLVFMEDSLRVAAGGLKAIRGVLPSGFNWPVFILALGLMAAPVVDYARQFLRLRELQPGD
jgi:hypothetical protein